MTSTTHLDHCACCGDPIHYREYTYSVDTFGISMCQDCARQYIAKMPKSTKTERLLYAALVNRGIQTELLYFDGFKTVDIAIIAARLHIEVDGWQHAEVDQGFSDLWRTFTLLRQQTA